MARGIFLMDANMLPKVWPLGLNASVAYIILCQGTGPDNSTTAWSTNAIERYTGIGRRRAADAIEINIAGGTIRRTRGGKFRKYAIEHSPDPAWIFLPNSLVVGANGEAPPIERIRRRGSLSALRMLIEAYAVQDLIADEGLDWRLIRTKYDRQLITERGLYQIIGFNREGHNTADWNFLLRHQFGIGRTSVENEAFWNAFNALQQCGLIECLPYLVESLAAGAEIIHPMIEKGTEAESALYLAATEASTALLDDNSGFGHELDDYEFAIPVNRDWPDAEIVGVFRLRYRPHTKSTAAWFARQQIWTEFATKYGEICGVEHTSQRRA